MKNRLVKLYKNGTINSIYKIGGTKDENYTTQMDAAEKISLLQRWKRLQQKNE